MRIPAVAIAAAFSGGIVLGQSVFLNSHAGGIPVSAIALGIALTLLFLGLLLVWRNLLWSAAFASLASWMVLGILAGTIVRWPLPAEHVLLRIAARQIPTRTPLRWYGVLRSEPARLPWGYGLEMSLTGVERAEGYLPVTGGMRLGFTPREGQPALPALHAGDKLSVLAEAHLPLVYKDAGAFDRREFLASQDVHVLATLRASTLLEKMGEAPPSLLFRVARWRGHLRNILDSMFSTSPQAAGILRAMLLGDRSFVDRAESVDFQKTGVFHVLVVAGLHVGALAVFLFWLAKWLRLPRTTKIVLILAVLFAYVAIVEQRAPVLRAGLMTAIVLLGSVFYRRLDLLNSAALAALVLLVARPQYVADTGFQLSFVAMGCIGGIAQPLIRRGIQPYLDALVGWRDVTRDTRHAPSVAQFRLDFRDAVFALTARLSGRVARCSQNLAEKVTRGWLWAAELFLLSVVLQFGMLAPMARTFHRVSLLGPLVNLFAVPLTGVIVPLGFLSLVMALVLPGLGRLLALPLTWLVVVQGRIVSFFAAIPYGSYRIPGPPGWVMAAFFVLVLGVVLALRQQDRLPRWTWPSFGLGLAVIAGIIATYPFRPTVNANQLEVTILDVGQGDSILVVSPKGTTLLIDGGGAFEGFQGREEHLGPDPGEEAVSAYLWSRGFQKLDAVALTHAHQDHIGGLTAVLQNFHVSRLWLGRETAAPSFARLKQLATRLNVRIEQEQRGQSFLWDGVQVDFLWPENVSEEIAATARNNDSLVVRLRYGDRTIFLPGDAEKQAEYSILAENEASFLHADVLKVGHHGSKNSTMPGFLAAVAPQVAVISAGEENPYGHPSPELLDRLDKSVPRVLRTDREGVVQVLTDGHALQVNCYVACPEFSGGDDAAHAQEHSQAAQQSQK
jgi:competence protein ComEC